MSGRMRAISWATKLPMEKPSRSTWSKLQGVEERDGIVRHVLDGVRGGPAGAAHPGVVEGDDPARRGERVDQGGIPVVEVAAEVLEQHQGRSSAALGSGVAEA